MAQVQLYDGRMTMKVQYLKLSRTGIYQYYRRVPSDLRAHCGGQFIVKSLGTKDATKATKLVLQRAAATGAFWKTLRSPQGRELGLVPPGTRAAAMSLLEHLGYVPGERTTSEHYDPVALDEYLERRYGHEFAVARHEGASDPMEFRNGVEREVVRQLNVDPSTKPPVLLSDALSRYLADTPRATNQSSLVTLSVWLMI